MRRLIAGLAIAVVVAVAAVVGMAMARPESLPGALRVTASVAPDDSAARAAVIVTPLSADIGASRFRLGAAPDRPAELTRLPEGTYDIAVDPTSPDADVVSMTCSPASTVSSVDQSGSAVVTIPAGVRVDCSAEVHERGRLVLRHRTAPASDEPTSFETSWGEALALAHKQSIESSPLPSGTHSVTPDLKRGWDVTAARCSNGSTPDVLEVAPGEQVTCTIAATQRGRVSLEVESAPEEVARDFVVKPSWAKRLTVAPGQTIRSGGLEPGTYDVVPRAPTGWDVAGSSCDNGDSLDDIRVRPGQEVTCRVEFAQRGRVVVATLPDQPMSSEFEVAPSWTDPFVLVGETSKQSGWLKPGSHDVSVDPPTGWALTEATCDDGSDPGSIDLAPGETVTCTFSATQPRFTVASFNVLGHSHSEPGGHSPGRPSGPTRMQWTMDLLRSNGVDVVGLQEFQRPQMDAFVRQSGGEFAVFPSPDSPQQNKQNAVAWRTSQFSLVEGRPVMMPYFKGNLVPMPLVRLRHNETGLEIYVMSVHNPASIRQLGDQSRWRAAAKSQQISFTENLLAEGIPFFMTGDMNERASYFCDYTASGLMHAAAGGSRGGACSPPPADRARIDWVFGSNDVEFSEYRLLSTDLVRRASDHPLVVTEALILD